MSDGIVAVNRETVVRAIERLSQACCAVPSGLDLVTVQAGDVGLISGFALGALTAQTDSLGGALQLMELEHAFNVVDAGKAPPVLTSTAANLLVSRYVKIRELNGVYAVENTKLREQVADLAARPVPPDWSGPKEDFS